jgi:hypothetical protein
MRKRFLSRAFIILLSIVASHSCTFSQDETVIAVRGRFVIAGNTSLPTIPGNFSFPITSTVRTSGGVFSEDGVLLRTLWNNRTYTAGTHTEYYDGLDDNGVLVTVPYTIKVLTNDVTYTWQGVIGNTSSSFTGNTIHHGYEIIRSMAINGSTAYVAKGYDEAQGTKNKIDLTSPQEKTWILPSGQGTTQGTLYTATDGTNTYWAEWSPYAHSWWVHRTSVAADAQVSFSSGSAYTPLNSIAYASVIDYSTDTIRGLDVSSNFIFVCHADTLKVYTKSTGAIAQNILISSKAVRVDGSNIWLVVGGQVKKYTVAGDGTIGSATLTLSGTVDPLAMGITGSTIAVVDGSTAQQVKAYNTTTGASSWTLGQSGGYSTSATVADDKFMFDTRAYIAFESDGSFWLGDPGNWRNQHFSSSRTYIDNIAYLPLTYIISVDENDPTRVFAGSLEYAIDYGIELGPNNGSWTLVKNWGYNLPADNNEQESFRNVYTLSNGRTYTEIRDGIADWEVCELVAGGNLRRTGVSHNVQYELSPDGSLTKQWSRDQALGHTVWVNKPLTGFTSNNPVWGDEVELDRTGVVTKEDPAWLGNGQEYKPHEVTSTGIRMNFYGGIDSATNTSFHVGGVKDGVYLWKTGRSTHTNYLGPFPEDGAFDIGNSVNNFAGTNAMAIERSVFWGYHGEFYKGGQTNIWNHLYDNGLMLGQFGTADGSYREGYAAMAGNGFSTKVVKVGDDYYLFHNDESYHSGIHLFKISNLESIEEVEVSTPTSNARPAVTYIDLMAGLPFNTTLPASLGWARSTPNANFSVYTSRLTCDKNEGRDIYATFSEGSGSKTITKTLGLAAPTSTWSVSAQVTWNGSTPNYGLGAGGVFLDILDNAGKKISTFYYTTNYASDTEGHIIGNGAEVFADDLAMIGNGLTKELHDLVISASGSTITFTYAGHTVSTSSLGEGGADITRPTTLQVRYLEDTTVHYDKKFGMANLRFAIAN